MTPYQKTIQHMADMRGCSYKNMVRRMRKYDNIAVALYGAYHTSRRRAHRYSYHGGIYTIPELAEMAGITVNSMRTRLRTKTVEEAMQSGDLSREKLYPYMGGHYTVTQLAEMAGCGIASMRKRIRKYGSENCMKTDKGGAKPKLYTHQGKQYTIMQLANMYGVTDAAIRRNIRLYGVERAVEMAKERQQLKSQPKAPVMPVRPETPDIDSADPDYELKNRIASYRAAGWSDDEILVKLRVA